MKRNKIMLAFLMVMSVLMLQSCYKDDEKVFDKNSANRMEEYLENAKSVITSGDATWLMEMYPHGDIIYGGYSYTLKFDKESVSVRSELQGYNKEATSLWKMTNNDGPCISFDTYNPILHYLSTPSSSSYEAYGGEFEWVVMDVKQDVIRLRGKKTGNTVMMYRMKEDPAEYLKKVAAVDAAMIFTGLRYKSEEGTINGVIDSDNRQVTFTNTKDNDEVVNVPYCVTQDGITFYEEVEVMGKKIKDLKLVLSAAGDPVSMDEKTSGLSFDAVFPDGWRPYDSYAGDYTIYYNRTTAGYNTIDVTLEPAGDGASYFLKGLNPNYFYKMSYKKATGTLQLCTQLALSSPTENYVAANGNYVGLVSWAAAQGYISYSATVGMNFVWDGNEEGPMTLVPSDNGVWGTYKVSSYTSYYFKSTTMSSTYRVSMSGSTDDYIKGTYSHYQFPYPEYMIKK